VDDHIGLAVFEQLDNVGGGTGCFLDHAAQIFAETVMGHAAHHRDVEMRDLCKFIGVIGFGEDRLRKIPAHLVDVHIDPHRELDIADVITIDAGVHNPWNHRILCGVLVELNPLYERGSTVPHSDDCDAYFFADHVLKSP